MLNRIKKYIIIFFMFTILFCVNNICFATFAENLSVNFSYGINNVAKYGNELPVSLAIENKDSVDFNGKILINVYENNNSVYIYKNDVSIKSKDKIVKTENIAITDKSNTVILEVINNMEEQVYTERVNLDLTYYNERVIVGVITSNYQSVLPLDNVSISNNTKSLKIVEITSAMYQNNKNIFDEIDVLLLSDNYIYNFDDGFKYAIDFYIENNKPTIVLLGGEYGIYNMPQALMKEINGPTIERAGNTIFSFQSGEMHKTSEENLYAYTIETDRLTALCMPYGMRKINTNVDYFTNFIDVIERSLGYLWDNNLFYNNKAFNSDYFNINSLLNFVDRLKLPDIFKITILLIVYVFVLTIIIYSFLRNINKRILYGRVAVVFSIIYTIIMISFGYSTMKKNTFLTYISIVSIEGNNTKERAFLNFRTSENGSYTFNTNLNNKLYPVLRPTKEPILSLNFIDLNNVKRTTFEKVDNRRVVSVSNAKDFDSNVFVYENNNYLNEVYSVDCSFNRFDGEVTGRITNKMNINIRDAAILLYGKIIKIGDIEANRSITLNRSKTVNTAVGNNVVMAETLSNNFNKNIIKYYLDENLTGYYDYGLLFGFIDNNGTIDINSSDIGDIYGNTLLVTKIYNNAIYDSTDVCSLAKNVTNMQGRYYLKTNSIDGDVEVINEYSFDSNNVVEHIYFEGVENYDHGDLNSIVPFYGDILAFDRLSNLYVQVEDSKIQNEDLHRFLSSDNKIIIKYVPTSRDPLYRQLSLPIMRAVVNRR